MVTLVTICAAAVITAAVLLVIIGAIGFMVDGYRKWKDR